MLQLTCEHAASLDPIFLYWRKLLRVRHWQPAPFGKGELWNLWPASLGIADVRYPLVATIPEIAAVKPAAIIVRGTPKDMVEQICGR